MIKPMLMITFLNIGLTSLAMEPNREAQLLKAAENGDFALVQQLVAQGTNVNCQDARGYTPLITAASNQQKGVCIFLLYHGANVNTLSREAGPALNFAFQFYNFSRCKNGQELPKTDPELITLLLKHGANPFLVDCERATPHLKAARCFQGSQFRTEADIYLRGILTIVDYLKSTNNRVKTTLLCLNRARCDESNSGKLRQAFAELYRNFSVLLLPHFDKPLSIKKLLNMKDRFGKTAYDYIYKTLQNHKHRNGNIQDCLYCKALDLLQPEPHLLPQPQCAIM